MKFSTGSRILKEVKNKPLPVLYFNTENNTDDFEGSEKDNIDSTCTKNKEAEKNEILNETLFSNLKESLILFTTNELKNMHESDFAYNQKSLTNSQDMFDSSLFNITYNNSFINRCGNRQKSSAISLCNNRIESCNIYQSPVCHQDNDGFKIPVATLKRKINVGNLISKTGRAEPKTPVKAQKIDCFLTPSSLKITTPLGTLTPFLMQLGRDSQSPKTPMVLTGEMFSTPAIVNATKPWKGAPDILSIIDDDSLKSSYIECKVHTFDDKPLLDCSITEFITGFIEDYAPNEGEQTEQNHVHATSNFVVNRSEPMQHHRGNHCKKLPQDIEEVIKLKQKEKSKKKGRKRKHYSTEDTEVLIKRRLNSCCRRTRSLVKAAEEIGLDVGSIICSQSKEE